MYVISSPGQDSLWCNTKMNLIKEKSVIMALRIASNITDYDQVLIKFRKFIPNATTQLGGAT